MSLQEHRRNQDIRAPQLRLIDQDGEMKGIVNRAEALRMAEENELDLVEIQPNGDPPVCRIMDYGKFRYELQKKQNVAKKHQKQIETKEIQFRPVIDQHDYNTKLEHVRQFLEEGNKVRLVVRMKGRERNNPELGQALINRLTTDLSEQAQFEKGARMAEGMMMVVAPLPKQTHKPHGNGSKPKV